MPSYDKINKRATFGILYPSDDIEFEKIDAKNKFNDKTETVEGNLAKRFVKSKRMTFKLDNSTFRKIIFDGCNFHNNHGEKYSELSSVSFEDCDFKNSFFGTTEFYKVVFKRCTFQRCDYMNSIFRNCKFINCTFEKCTAYNIMISTTEINPILFLDSIEVPFYNFPSITKAIKFNISREWIDVKLHIARQLVKSSSEIHHTKLIDDSIYKLKSIELLKTKDKLVNPIFHITDINGEKKGFWYLLFFEFQNLFNYIFGWVNQLSTRGGTSLIRLILISLFFIFLISYHLLHLNTAYGKIDLSISWLTNIPFSISLFLGFGFSGFSFPVEDSLILVAYALFGIIWYALLIPVLIRKIYR